MTVAPSFDPTTTAAYQFHGQDVGWLLDHWAANRGDHPFLVWEPRDGATKTWTYAEFAEATKQVAAGLAAFAGARLLRARRAAGSLTGRGGCCASSRPQRA